MRLTKTFYVAAALLASLGASACGRSGLGRSPSQVVIDTLEGASGAKPDTFGSTLLSDVVTQVTLKPDIVWAGNAPDAARLAQLHHEAHETCFIANSVKTKVTIV